MLTQDPNDLRTYSYDDSNERLWYLKEDGITPDLADNDALKDHSKLIKNLLDEI